jgi:hypothetical protein
MTQVVPWGLRKILNWIKKEYNNVPVVITENGFSDTGELNDTERTEYLVVSENDLYVQLTRFNVFSQEDSSGRLDVALDHQLHKRCLPRNGIGR